MKGGSSIVASLSTEAWTSTLRSCRTFPGHGLAADEKLLGARRKLLVDVAGLLSGGEVVIDGFEQLVGQQRDVLGPASAGGGMLSEKMARRSRRDPRGSGRRAISACRSRLVAAMMRTSAVCSWSPPTRRNRRTLGPSVALGCTAPQQLGLHVEIALPHFVVERACRRWRPPNAPSRSVVAPEKEPLACPNSSDSGQVLGHGSEQVDGHERLGRPTAVLVHATGEESSNT
jgi:hypothetical protein